MKTKYKQLAITLILAVIGINIAHALAPAGKPVTGSIALQGGSASTVKYAAPATSAYKVHVFIPKAASVPVVPIVSARMLNSPAMK